MPSRTRVQVFPLEPGETVVTAAAGARLVPFVDAAVFPRGVLRIAVLESDVKGKIPRRIITAPLGQSAEVPDGHRAELLAVLALAAPPALYSVVELEKIPKK